MDPEVLSSGPWSLLEHLFHSHFSEDGLSLCLNLCDKLQKAAHSSQLIYAKDLPMLM